VEHCPSCGTATGTADRYCEVCGRDLRERATHGTRWLSSSGEATACVGGGEHLDGDHGCRRCGQWLATGRDRVELGIGPVAGITDRGLRRRRNEDAVAVGRTGTATAAVVCDGVSYSSRADTAALAATDAGIRALLLALDSGRPPREATMIAARVAIDAVVDLNGPQTCHNPPSCTYVSAVVTADTVTVGWVGDSRAYWLGAGDGSSCLTVDDTLAGQLRGAGVGVDPKLGPQAAALIRWVGADAGDIEPHIATFDPPGSGRVLLCTDGLSRYLSVPGDLAAAAAGEPPEVAARLLTQLALDAGGHDNITVVVAAFPPAARSGPWQAHPEGEPSR
jgi:PPM family protein phosphatase